MFFFCKNDKETIDHLFWHCEVIQLFIEQLKPLMSNYIFHPTKQTLLLGDIDDMERNLLYLEINFFIYHCKRKTLPLSVGHFIAVLKHKLSIYTYNYTDVTDDSLPCALKLIKDIVTV